MESVGDDSESQGGQNVNLLGNNNTGGYDDDEVVEDLIDIAADDEFKKLSKQSDQPMQISTSKIVPNASKRKR